MVNMLNLQAEYFDSDEKEELKMDTLKTIQTYMKKIFRQAKFLSDSGINFEKPNFVVQNGLKSQSVEICEYLWKSLGKDLFVFSRRIFITYSNIDRTLFVVEKGKEPSIPTLKDKIMFWKTYHRYVKSEINRMRQVSTNTFKTNFIKGE